MSESVQALQSLIIWMAIGGYVLGRRKGKGGKYALLSVPISCAIVVAINAALA